MTTTTINSDTCQACHTATADTACVDLCMYLCTPCYDAFDAWERTKPEGAMFADWPGLMAVTA